MYAVHTLNTYAVRTLQVTFYGRKYPSHNCYNPQLRITKVFSITYTTLSNDYLYYYVTLTDGSLILFEDWDIYENSLHALLLFSQNRPDIPHICIFQFIFLHILFFIFQFYFVIFSFLGLERIMHASGREEKSICWRRHNSFNIFKF